MNTEFLKRAGKYVSKRKTSATVATGGGLSLAGLLAFGYNLDKQIEGHRQWNIRQSERITAIEKVLNERHLELAQMKWDLQRLKEERR